MLRSDEALCEALLGGDARAFDVLYARYERPLFGFIRRHLAERAEAEDVLHEAFLAILRDRVSVRRAASFRAWLFQVARHLCLNRLRSRRRSERALEVEAQVPPSAEAHPEHALEERQTREALRDAVGRLPLELAELYQLRASGMSYEEMANVLEVPLGTVKSRMHKMVECLREEMRS